MRIVAVIFIAILTKLVLLMIWGESFRDAGMIKRVLGEIAQQLAQGFRGVEAMAFGKSLYLLEALLPPDSETVRYCHITGEVTDLSILLQILDFTHVTVSNLLKPILANSFVLRLQPSLQILSSICGAISFFERGGGVHEKVSVFRSDYAGVGLWIGGDECRWSGRIRQHLGNSDRSDGCSRERGQGHRDEPDEECFRRSCNQ